MIDQMGVKEYELSIFGRGASSSGSEKLRKLEVGKEEFECASFKDFLPFGQSGENWSPDIIKHKM
jgi:hypothetical protein